MKQPLTVFWFRRDLRLHDNAGLHLALRGDYPVMPLFIFDQDILRDLRDKSDRRVEFIHQTLREMQDELASYGSSLLVRHGSPTEVWRQLIAQFDIARVYSNADYEPYAINRDSKIAAILESRGIEFKAMKDQVIFAEDDVLKANREPYTVYTPYKNAWKKKLFDSDVLNVDYAIAPHAHHFWQTPPQPIPSLQEIGFRPVGTIFPAKEINEELIRKYHLQRDIPGIAGTSRLGVHLRFGTVSIRDLVRRALLLNETWLDELIWREFFMMILHRFPHVENRSFREKYDDIAWRNNRDEFDSWCNGRTGFPLVDAGMRELNETGFMHNRVRMVTASFLTKHLLINWRWGERYFAEKLLDYDLAANNGNWQWAAGTGCDAAPYFRVFNPT
ncbi:deoxyribodipyrimidine photo-lyase, partial [candidate division KSB1 bacterium]